MVQRFATGQGRAASGFLLVEVMAAGFVLSVAAVGLAAALAQGGTLVDAAREEYAARGAMSDVLAQLAIEPWEDVAATWDKQGFAVPGLRAVPGDPDGLPGEIDFDYGPAGEEEFYTVRLRVHWVGQAGEREIDGVYFLANVRGDSGTPPPLN